PVLCLVMIGPTSSANAKATNRGESPRGTCRTDWQIVSSPNVPGRGTTLADVAAFSTSDTWAVGWSGSINAGFRTAQVFEHWDGTTWSLVSGPDTHGQGTALNGVAGTAGDDVWAVGYEGSGEFRPKHALAEHWDGRAWHHVPIRSPGLSAFLRGVA